MALVLAATDLQDVEGRHKSVLATATIASYTVGGDGPVTTEAAKLGLKRVTGVDIRDGVSSTGFVWRYDTATDKLQAFRVGAAVATPLAESSAAANVGVINVQINGD